jgi:hypothetical protein
MERVKDQLEGLKIKHRKVTLLLGEAIYRLYKLKTIRFLYTSDGIEDEREVKKILNLLDYMVDRIKKFEEIYSKAEFSRVEKKRSDKEAAKSAEPEDVTVRTGDGRVEEKKFAGKYT